MDVLRSKSDLIGTYASGLCMIHCLATPFLFVAQTCAVRGCCDTSPAWWSAIDYLFVGITLFAVYWSASQSSSSSMKVLLYVSWVCLTLVIFNEKWEFLSIASYWKYIAGLFLIGLHLYNRKFCQCTSEKCAVSV